MQRQIITIVFAVIVGVVIGVLFGRIGPSDLDARLADAERRYLEAQDTVDRAEAGIRTIAGTLGVAVDQLDGIDEAIIRADEAADRAVERTRELESGTRDLQDRIVDLEGAVAGSSSINESAAERHREIEAILGRILFSGSEADQ